MARTIQEMSEGQFVQSRLNIWFGSDMPRSVSAKELADNGLDQIADKLARNVHIIITKDSIVCVDDGKGISLDVADEKTGQSHLFKAFGKLYTSSNYGGAENTIGTNGVGGSCTNFISSEFKCGMLKGKHVTGYIFHNGKHADDGKTLDKFDIDEELDIDKGFYVSAKYNPQFTDDEIDIEWIVKYLEKRTGELPEGSKVHITRINGVTQDIEFNKIVGSANYVKSWEEQVNEVNSEIIRLGNGFTYAFSKDNEAFKNITSMVQGAPVNNSTNFRAAFPVDTDVTQSMSLPYTFYYKGKALPKYTDQTKKMITMKSADIIKAMKLRANEIYTYFLNLAKDAYLKSILKDNSSNSYWPSLGKAENSELIIAEGYSAISGIKAKRNPQTQACLGLRGKILNVMQKSLKNAMKSDIVSELLSIIKTNNFEKIIIAVDADPSGSHICTLLLAVFHRFAPQLLEEGKVYYCHTPLYTFRKGQDYKWSDDGADCPEGYKTHVLKGLGSMESKEIEMFILDENTRDLWQFEYDMPNAEKMLNFSLVTGGEGWIDGIDDKEYDEVFHEDN